MLKFEGGLIVGEHMQAWSLDEWPPPERLGIGVSTLSGKVFIIDPADAEHAAEMEALSTVEVRWYTRKTYSQLPPAFEGDLFRRGAHYVEEEPQP